MVNRIKDGPKTKMMVILLIAGVKKLYQKKSSLHSNSHNKIIKPVKRMKKKKLSLSKRMQSRN